MPFLQQMSSWTHLLLYGYYLAWLVMSQTVLRLVWWGVGRKSPGWISVSGFLVGVQEVTTLWIHPMVYLVVPPIKPFAVATLLNVCLFVLWRRLVGVERSCILPGKAAGLILPRPAWHNQGCASAFRFISCIIGCNVSGRSPCDLAACSTIGLYA